MLRKICKRYTDLFCFWIVFFGVVAYYYPDMFVPLRKHMEIFFALTMFGIGAVLKSGDFDNVLKHPASIAIGSIAQFTVMPICSYIVAKMLGLPPELAVGLILAGCAPGAMSSNVLCYVAKADVAYSVSLTTVSTFLCPLLTPGLTFLLASSMLKIDFAKMFINLIFVVILPVVSGYFIRHKFNDQIEKIEPVFPAVSTTFIIFICSLVIAMNKQYLSMVTGSVLAAVILLNLLGMAIGYNIGRIFAFSTKMKRTLTIEIGMQNAGLGTVLALKYFGAKSAIPAAVFVFVCIITASILSGIWQSKKA